MKADPTAQKIAEDFDKREDNMHTIRADLEKNMGDILRKLADPNSGLFAQFKDYWERRLPAGQQRSSWSVEQLITAIEDEKFTKSLIDSGELPPVEASLKTKMKEGLVTGTKALLQGFMHAAAIGLSVLALVEGGTNLHALETAQIAFTLAAEGLSMIGSAARRLITWGIARVKGWTRTISWFFSVSDAGMKKFGQRSV
jgi:hypothetical protein